jgi:hypothetical protein
MRRRRSRRPNNDGGAEQIAFIPEENDALAGLGEVNRELVQELGKRCPDQRIATLDQDATIIES